MFTSSIVDIVDGLHADGSLSQLLGRDVPVLINASLEGEESLRDLNRRANPTEFHRELDRWSARRYAD